MNNENLVNDEGASDEEIEAFIIDFIKDAPRRKPGDPEQNYRQEFMDILVKKYKNGELSKNHLQATQADVTP